MRERDFVELLVQISHVDVEYIFHSSTNGVNERVDLTDG